jgi:ureidoacrylate peracid hydrolase
MSDIIDQIQPQIDDIIIEKTTYSPFTNTNIHTLLHEKGISKIIMTGLATSQCVETTARDASDHNYEIIQVEDAQADYDELTHVYSLFSSKGVCGSTIITTDDLISILQNETEHVFSND